VPHEEIVALATDELADLLVIGTHGRGGMSRALLGSVADRVVRLAPCPVLTVRGPA
jgi:nucleotide-binding universal stress UspA family protein